MAAHNFLFDRPTLSHLDRLCEVYQDDEYPTAVFNLLGELKRWVPIDTYYQILNISCMLSTEVKKSISQSGTSGFLSQQIVDGSYFEIPSRLRLRQIVESINSLSALPSIELYNVLGGGLSSIDSEGEFTQLWEFEERYELARDNWESILREDQLAALLGRATENGNITHAIDIVEAWIGPRANIADIDEKYDEAREAKGIKALENWRTTLRYAVEEPQSQLEYSVANYLYHFYQNFSDKYERMYIMEEICRCAYRLFEERKMDDFALYMKYQYFSISGRKYRIQDDYKRAEEAYKEYLAAGLEGLQHGINGVNKHWPIYWLYKTRGERYREKGEYERATNELQKGQKLLRSLEVPNHQEAVEDLISRLNAIRHEIRGDRELDHHNLDTASSHYGRAIGIYTEQEMEKSQKYLKQRRNLIKASLAEQEGDFKAAQEAHEAIVSLTEDRDFREFNQARADITKAKQKAVELAIAEAREHLPIHLQTSNVAHAEAKHLAFLLGLISEYENDGIQEVGEVLDKLQTLPDLTILGDEFPFEYGHDYRPAVVNTLAAQRLNQFDIDKPLLNELLKVSIKEVLTPNSVQQQIIRSGIGHLDLQSRWKHYFPLHIVRRYQEIREKEISNVNNYVDEGLALLKLVEQALEFSGDYYAQQEFGSNWMTRFSENDSNRLSLRPLRELLNTEPMEELVWCDAVRDLIDKPLIGEDDLIEARNALGHDRRARILQEGYEEIHDRVELILARMRTQIPVVVTPDGRTGLGLIVLEPHWENPRKIIRVQTDASFNDGMRYYIPFEEQTADPVVQIDGEKILPVQSERVTDNLNEYMNNQ